jgi:hypothetical protein
MILDAVDLTDCGHAPFRPVALGADGSPEEAVVVVDLDRPAAWAHVEDRPDWFAGSRVTLGRATRPLCAEALEVARRLTATVVASQNTREARPPGGSGSSGPAAPSCLVEVDDVDAAVQTVLERVGHAPRAGVALDGLLRLTERVGPEVGVVAESFAYSMLLASPEFTAWRVARPRRPWTPAGEPVRVHRDGSRVDIVLDRPDRGNSFSADLRQALVEALRFTALDPSVVRVVVSGTGRHFSTGGDLDEFGTSRDPAAAHAVRLDQSAGLAVHRLRDRVEVHLHGRCVGAGIEVPAFAGHVAASPGTTFRLPELELGLVPGAGGTVSLPARIGRWRTAYLVLAGVELELPTAMAWGLVDAVH